MRESTFSFCVFRFHYGGQQFIMLTVARSHRFTQGSMLWWPFVSCFVVTLNTMYDVPSIFQNLHKFSSKLSPHGHNHVFNLD
jgi:hypothetical protein